jgi:hypothetical protein
MKISASGDPGAICSPDEEAMVDHFRRMAD